MNKNTLPTELKETIFKLPMYRQEDAKQFLGYPSSSSLEQGRLGIGAFSGLHFTRVGRSVYYPAIAIVDFLESLPCFRNTTEADQYQSTVVDDSGAPIDTQKGRKPSVVKEG